MPRIRRTDPEIDALAAALLASQGMTQAQIAQTLHLNQTAVSRLLRTKSDYLERTTRFRVEKVGPEVIRRVQARISPQQFRELGERLAVRHSLGWVPVVHVFDGPHGASYLDRMRSLARQAAPRLHDMIRRCRSVGVTWGGMLRVLVDALDASEFPSPWTESPIDVIPLSGEPLGDEPTAYSSSNLAHDLNHFVNGTDKVRSLGMVPAFLPQGFRPEHTEGVWRLIGLVPSYHEIFARRPVPLAATADMILTSVGRADRPLGFVNGRLLATGGVTPADLSELILGDMGGVCFPKPGLDAAARKRLKSVTDRWTGLKMEHLTSCASRAAARNHYTGPPGVTVVTIGKERAPAIFESIRLGLVNHLMIDGELASELLELCGRPVVDAPGAMVQSRAAPRGAPGGAGPRGRSLHRTR